MKIRQKSFESYLPICEICGEKIYDDTFRMIDTLTYHDKCIEMQDISVYVENKRMEDEIYGYER